MEKINLTEKQKELIERLGVFWEGDGSNTRVEARIMSLLLVSDNTELSFEAICETLNLSKSAASNAINLLLTIEKIEYFTKPGERKRYFRVRITHWEKMFTDRFAGLSKMIDLLKEVNAQRPKSTTEFNTSFASYISFIEVVNKEIPLLYERWKKKRK